MTDFGPRARSGLTLRAHALTWHHALFALTRGERTVYLLRDQSDANAFLVAFESGELDTELHRVLDAPPRARLSRRVAHRYVPRVNTGTLVGLEREYSLFGAHDIQVDFGELIHTLPVEGVRADPADPNAYRCPWGGVLTRDGKEAEVAIPPVAVEPGFADASIAIADAGEEALSALVPDLRIDGYSTHVSVSLRVRDDRRFCLAYTRTFAPALMLLMDRARSPGMLVRPRPGRLELCGEYVAGNVARAAVAFAVGSVRALARMDRGARRDLAVRTRIEPAVERYGYYVDRTAFGPDLYAAGRGAALAPGRGGKGRTAQQHLERAWALARAELIDVGAAEDLAAADAMVTGVTPLPCEDSPQESPNAYVALPPMAT